MIGRVKRRLRSGRSGVAAIEFALILPVMMVFVVGTVDTCKLLILWEQVYNAAHTIPVSASIVSVQPDKTTLLTAAQAQQQMSAIYAEIPWLRDGLEHGTVSVTLSSVAFVPIPGCTQTTGINCFIPMVKWSVPYRGGVPAANAFQLVSRPCGAVIQLHPTDPVPMSLPLLPAQLTFIRTRDVMQPDPILVADVHYKYTPFLLQLAAGSLDLWATGYWSVRSVDPTLDPTLQYTKYTPDSYGGLC